MKKKLLPVVALASTILLAGCFSENDPNHRDPVVEVEKPDSFNIYAPDGTPAMAIAGIMQSKEMEGVHVECTLVNASEIGSVFSAYPDCDLAIMPTVSAATIYSKGMDVSYVSANVWGNLYVVGVGSASSLSDLTGKVVYTTTGTTIALLEYELAANNIAFEMGTEAKEGVVTIYSMNAASDYLPLIKQAQMKGGEAYGVLGEPAVTKCMSAVATQSKIVVDMQKEYEKLTGMEGYPQACLVARSGFAIRYKGFIRHNLMTAMEGVNDYLNENLSDVSTIFEGLGSTALLGIPYTADTFTRCNLRVEYKQVKDTVQKYVENMAKYVPSLQGIKLDNNFFLFAQDYS